MRHFIAMLIFITLSGNAMADNFIILAGNKTVSDDWIVKSSANSVPDTVSKLTTAIEGAGATVFAVVDHAAGAAKVGSELPPATLVIFGNPKIGTPVMQNNIRAGLDLPLRVLVFEDGRETKIGYLHPDVLKARYDVTGVDEVFGKIGGALSKLTDAASQ